MELNVQIQELECPICFDIPTKEIYQCSNGHLVCHSCNNNLLECPQCFVSLEGNGKCRNRFMEAQLDKLKFECPHVNVGCKEKLPRKDLLEHGATCKFGERIEYCKFLGYSNCTFKVYTLGLSKVLPEHLLSVHGARVCYHLANKWLNLEGFYQANIPESTRSCFYHFQLEGRSTVFVLVCKIREGFVSMACVNLDADETIPNELFKISIEDARVEYKMPIIPVREIEQIMNDFPLRISVNYLTRLHRASSENQENSTLRFRMQILQHSSDSLSESVEEDQSPIALYNDESDIGKYVNVPIGRKLQPGTILNVLGKIASNAHFISIHLKTSDEVLDEGDPVGDLALCIQGYHNGYMNCSSYSKNGGWGRKVKDKIKFRLCRTKEFDLEIKCVEDNCYSVKINGENCFEYMSVVAMENVTHLGVTKDAIVSKIIIRKK